MQDHEVDFCTLDTAAHSGLLHIRTRCRCCNTAGTLPILSTLFQMLELQEAGGASELLSAQYARALALAVDAGGAISESPKSAMRPRSGGSPGPWPGAVSDPGADTFGGARGSPDGRFAVKLAALAQRQNQYLGATA
jgi:hypothetical protein